MTAVDKRPTIFSFLRRETGMDIAGEIYNKIHKQDLIELFLQGGPGALSAIRRWDEEAWNLLNCGERFAIAESGINFYRHPDGRMWYASKGYAMWNRMTKKNFGFDRTRAMTTFKSHHMFLTNEGEIYLYDTNDFSHEIYLVPEFSALNLRSISGGVALDYAGNIYRINITRGQLSIDPINDVQWITKPDGFDPTLLRSVHLIRLRGYDRENTIIYVGFWKSPTGPVTALYSPEPRIDENYAERWMGPTSHTITWRRDPSTDDYELMVSTYDSETKRVIPFEFTVSTHSTQININVSNFFDWTNFSLGADYLFVDMDGHNLLPGIRRALDEFTLIAMQVKLDDISSNKPTSSFELVENCFSQSYYHHWMEEEFRVRKVDPNGPDVADTIELIKADVAIRWRDLDEQAIFDVNRLEEQVDLIAQAHHTGIISYTTTTEFVNEILRTRYRDIQSKNPVVKLRGEVVDVRSVIIENPTIYYNYVITVDLDNRKTYLYMIEEINGLPRIGWYWNFDE